MTYDASSIKVLTPEEAGDKFSWIKAGQLSQDYGIPLACVERGLEATKILNIEPSEYINRYITKTDKTKNSELIEVYTDLMRNK